MAEHELAQLIERRRQTAKESYGDIAERGGEHLSKSYVHKLATTEQPAMPKPEQVEALAAALEVPEKVVLRAAQQAAGYHTYEETTPDTGTEILIANVERLSPEQRASVAALVEHLLRGM
ncbi:helix-turn-helix domain-containing protein [Micromonospora sp. GCM10011541]|uniref:helix-turn-helix domain-containing protein n=1 Tax=Micromonospora sp. GCM10011541 TaxID=3317336 RepID=UPI00361B889C